MLATMTDPTGRIMREDVLRHGLDSPWIGAGDQRLAEMLRSIEHILETDDWLVGDSVTLAESAVMPLILRLEEFGLADLWQKSLPRLADWWARLKARPSTQQVIALADPAELATIASAAEPWNAPLLEMFARA